MILKQKIVVLEAIVILCPLIIIKEFSYKKLKTNIEWCWYNLKMDFTNEQKIQNKHSCDCRVVD